MIPQREKPKRIPLRPMIFLFLSVSCVGMLIARGGGWQVAGYILAAVIALAVLGLRILLRRIARARQPDPQSTLKI